MQLLKTSCSTSVVMQGTQHEGTRSPREFFAFLSIDDPANKQEADSKEEEKEESDRGLAVEEYTTEYFRRMTQEKEGREWEEDEEDEEEEEEDW